MLHWLIETASVFKIQHDAHREFSMTVDQHLRHRERIGDAPLFLDPRDREACICMGSLWELRVTLPDGTSLDMAGSSLEKCVAAMKARMEGDTVLAA